MDTALPENLSPGTILGPWRLTCRAGRGAYGAIYRAERVGQEAAGPVALKLSLHSREERFEREAEVLSRVRHPGIPRLLDRGEWVGGPWRVAYPYLVMDWVEGKSLDGWARAQPLSSGQVFRVLAQLSRALQAAHEAHCLHRDVKGDNVLVGPDGRVFLVDFGCGTYPEASPLTVGPLAPGTLPYRSPQSLRHQWAHRKDGASYEAGPEDDVYALGVTAYRLVTGMYPPPGTALEARQGERREVRPLRQPAHKLVPWVSPGLSALIERMLDEAPEARGRARELAEALEAEAASAGSEAEVSPKPFEAIRLESALPPKPPGRRAPVWAALAATGLVGMGTWHLSKGALHGLAGLGPLEAMKVGLANVMELAESLAAPARIEESERSGKFLAMEVPKRPFSGQRRPPCKRPATEIRGGCWVNVPGPCPNEDDGYEWNGKCFLPVASPSRPETSNYP
ncbi:serine/threonine-protein kinase [Stigmatella sp. ncwal1]|uniref:Serine/threonine-protein kinase n=1 Tax=Stigmatella ashevillensis TaxID=2995309 RepID=A0ABT5DM05_9BACT|nr:serine/threonine-protein kinase [Stigmatella ashevillena]MDC0713402.1 serine/threonine-protein kinase [Stigmatella ashevillena]